MSNIATLPVPAHIRILRTFIERETNMRMRVLKGDSQKRGLEDAASAKASIDALDESFRIERSAGDSLAETNAVMARRIKRAQEELNNLIDGGKECQGRDSEISAVMRILGGEAR